MNRRDQITAFFVILLICITAWLWWSPDGLNRAPQVTFRITDGQRINLQELHGQPVLVTFWATTCPGCIKEMPHLISLYEEFSGGGLEIIGVAMYYDPPNQVMKMIENRQIPYPVSLDPDGKIAQAFDNVMLTPTSFLIAPDGTIVRHKVGEMNMDKLEQQIRDLLFQQSQVTSHKLQEKQLETGT